MITFSQQSANALPPEARAFYAAMNDCSKATMQLHPVHARNIRMNSTWQAWMAKHPNLPKEIFPAHLIAGLDRNFGENVDLLQNVVLSHFEKLQVQITDKMCNDMLPGSLSAAASLMFWSRRHMIIETTAALEEVLLHSDLGNDLPIDLIRPPFPACYIRLGAAFQQAVVTTPMHQAMGEHTLQGVYVFEAVSGERRGLSFVPIFTVPALSKIAAGSIYMSIDDENASTDALIKMVCNDVGASQSPHFQSIVQLCAKIFLYMNLSQTVQLDDLSYTLALKQLANYGPKKLAKRQRQIFHLYDRILVGPQTLAQHGTGMHGEVAPHVRRGHFRMQAHGPKYSKRRVLFIAPTWIRADRL